MTTYNCKNMERCYYRGPSENQGWLLEGYLLDDVSRNNSMQIHHVICYCASIRDIPFNGAVRKRTTKPTDSCKLRMDNDQQICGMLTKSQPHSD